MLPYYASDDSGKEIRADIKRLKRVLTFYHKAQLELELVQYGYVRKAELRSAIKEAKDMIKERESVLAE